MQLLAFVFENKKNYNVTVNILLDPTMGPCQEPANYYGNHVILLVRKLNPQISLEDVQQEVCFNHVIILKQLFYILGEKYASHWRSV